MNTKICGILIYIMCIMEYYFVCTSIAYSSLPYIGINDVGSLINLIFRQVHEIFIESVCSSTSSHLQIHFIIIKTFRKPVVTHYWPRVSI